MVEGGDQRARQQVSHLVADKNAPMLALSEPCPGIPDIDQAMQEGWSTAPDEVRSLGFGAGMGLPNMKKYSDTIDIKSTVGVGTTVLMTVCF